MDVVQQLLEGKNRGKIVMCKDWDKSAGSYSNCEGELHGDILKYRCSMTGDVRTSSVLTWSSNGVKPLVTIAYGEDVKVDTEVFVVPMEPELRDEEEAINWCGYEKAEVEKADIAS